MEPNVQVALSRGVAWQDLAELKPLARQQGFNEVSWSRATQAKGNHSSAAAVQQDSSGGGGNSSAAAVQQDSSGGGGGGNSSAAAVQRDSSGGGGGGGGGGALQDEASRVFIGAQKMIGV